MTPTPRELDVTRLVAEGATNEAIALRLGISVWTVKQHLKSAFKKTGAANRTHLAVMYTKRDDT